MTSKHNLIGQQIDQYRILQYIASGGMATVYLAEDVNLERKAALKVMLDSLAASDPQFTERFRREAVTAAQLNHPNIVQVYSVGQTPDERPYIAMQYIEGGSLQEKLKELAERRKLLTTEQTLNIVRQIAQALSAAHLKGIIHRDLKPANVLIRLDGTPVLVDLGIAVIKGSKRLTQTGSMIGTPAYMSPEQVRGRPVDGRADLYALGIMLYEMLTGMPPFEGEDSVTVLHKQVYEKPLPLENLRPDLKQQTLDVVATTLQKDPAHRFQSAEDMVHAIDQALKAEGMTGPNPQATVVLTQMTDSKLLNRSSLILSPVAAQKKRPSWVWGIALLLLLAVTAGIFFIFQAGNNPPVVAEVETATAVPATQPAISPPVDDPSATPAPPTATLTPTATVTPTNTATQTPPPAPTPLPAVAAKDVTAMRLDTPPLIDGELSDWPPGPAILSAYDVFHQADWDGSDDVEASWRLGWDNTSLYVVVTVRDDTHVQTRADEKIWQGDSIEMQFDTDLNGDYDTPINGDDFQLNISPGDFQNVPAASYLWRADNGRYNPASTQDIAIASQPLPDGGYVIEAAIPWSRLALTPAAGMRLGLALNVSDNDQPGTAVQEMMKSNVETRTFSSPATWGTLTLP